MEKTLAYLWSRCTRYCLSTFYGSCMVASKESPYFDEMHFRSMWDTWVYAPHCYNVCIPPCWIFQTSEMNDDAMITVAVERERKRKRVSLFLERDGGGERVLKTTAWNDNGSTVKRLSSSGRLFLIPHWRYWWWGGTISERKSLNI